MAALKQLHADFLEDLEIGKGRSPKTVANYDHYLLRFYAQQHIQAISHITTTTVRQFRHQLSTKTTLATQNYHLIALRQFLKYLAQRDIKALGPEKIGLAKLGERDIDVLYPEEIDTLIHLPWEKTIEDARDRAIIETLVSTGMRISELVRLERDAMRETSDEIAVRGKGNKVRVVFLSDSARQALAGYLEQRGDIDPALFIRHKRGAVGPADDLRLTARSIQRLMKKRAAQAGLIKHITPHTLRHSFATDLLSNGADVRQVQQLLGHSSITTTQIYTHLTDVHLRDVHKKFHRAGK